MSHWNHRVLKEKFKDEDWYSIREVFYNDDGSIYAYTKEPVDIAGESIDALREYLQWCLDCLDKEILIDGEVKFVDDDSDDEEEFDTIDEFIQSLKDGEK